MLGVNLLCPVGCGAEAFRSGGLQCVRDALLGSQPRRRVPAFALPQPVHQCCQIRGERNGLNVPLPVSESSGTARMHPCIRHSLKINCGSIHMKSSFSGLFELLTAWYLFKSHESDCSVFHRATIWTGCWKELQMNGIHWICWGSFPFVVFPYWFVLIHKDTVKEIILNLIKQGKQSSV